MSKPKSKTKNYSGLSDALFGTKTYKTTINNGSRRVSGLGNSPKQSQKNASKKWNKK